MLTIGTRIKIVAFVVIGILVIIYIGLRYADLGPMVGLRSYYVVKVELADAGGIYQNADVTYRGATVGRVGPVNLTGDGVEVELDIDNSAPPIPARLDAAVADLSAVGEQYVDLRPNSDSGPFLHDGSVIPRKVTTTPLPVQDLLSGISSVASSVPTGSLRTVVDELYSATDGQGPNFQTLLDSSNSFTKAATADIPQTTQLINDSQTVLKTQTDESAAFDSFATNAALIAQQLDKSDGDIRALIGVVPQAAAQVTDLLHDNDPNLGILLANLLTTSDLTLTRQDGARQMLSELPVAVADGSSIINGSGVNFGMSLTFFDPAPCTSGYGGTPYRNGLDTSPGPGLNTGARCTASPGSGTDVRGSANAPSGGVPPAAHPGSP